ncbi:MAG: family 78 glycoside hydrolase catalytic domain [Lachnospiraceae bacterium]|nr:family 78 glycoside hydrolase catalytic domain [Lachnospiraceae bacterium]
MLKRGKRHIGIFLLLCVVVLSGCHKKEEKQYQTEYENAGSLSGKSDEKAEELPPAFRVEGLRTDWMEEPVGIDSAVPCFSWEIVSDRQGLTQKAYRISLHKKDEPDNLLWDSGTVFDSRTTAVVYQGKPLESHCCYTWELAVWDDEDRMNGKVSANFVTAYVGQTPFDGAKMIRMQGEENVYDEGQAVFVKDFDAAADAGDELCRATLYASALGIYDAYINGSRVGNDELKPGWSNYDESLYYNTYDITQLLGAGETNRIAVMLGTGWWCGRVAYGTYDYHKPAFVCAIRMEYASGQVRWVVTDESWRYVKDTAVVSADIYNGEVFDGRRPTTQELSDGVQMPEIADLKPVDISPDFDGIYHAFYGNPVRDMTEFTRIPESVVIYDSVSENGTAYGEIEVKRQPPCGEDLPLQKGETAIFDMGQNMAGVPYICFEAPEGTLILVDFAEMLNDSGKKKRGNDGPKGSLYTANYRSALSQLKLISDGEGLQEYRPVFTYYGFRYLSVTATEDVVLHRVEGRAITNSSPQSGWLKTDNDLLNRLFENAEWTQRNNFLLVATDCPQRDERHGWTGDLQVFAKTSLYNQDLLSFYRKWIYDCMESQTEEGAYTDTIPRTIITAAGNAGWGDAGISVPYDLYCMYGDKQLLETSYDSMQRYMTYLASISDFNLDGGRIGPLTTYADWLGFEASDKEMISTLCYAKDAAQMAGIAEILDDREGARAYRALEDEIREYFRQKYITDGHIAEQYRTQTTLILAMEYDLLDEEQDRIAAADLRQKLQQSGGKLTTGFLGTPLILKCLSDHGMWDEAYGLLLQTENPSWLYSVLQGATTIWERYDSYTLEKGFNDAAMNSFDHFNNGSVLAWMYEDMLGIRIDHSAADEVIVLRPGIVLDPSSAPIRHAEGGYHSVYGEIRACWDISDEQIAYEVQLPANTQGVIRLPLAGDGGTENRQEIEVVGGGYRCFYDTDKDEWCFSTFH